MSRDTLAYTGTWHCTYWFPSNEFVGEEASEYDMKVIRKGNDLVFESLPNAEKSYMLVRLRLDDDIASGTWNETTSPTGKFKGALYSGAGQLVVNPQTGRMEGKWAGAGYDYKLKAMRIYSGAWEIKPLGD